MADAFQIAASQLGMNETDQRIALQEFMTNGGVNLDPAVTAWCAAFVNASLKQAGIEGTGTNLARDFLNWGESVDQPQKGDIAVFSRGDPNGPYGHVGFFDGYNADGTIRLLSGNAGSAGEVNYSDYGTDRLLGFRRAPGAQTSTGLPVENALAGMPATPPQNALAPPQQPAFQYQAAQIDPRAFMRPTRNALTQF